MEKFNARDIQIYEDLKQCITDFGLKIRDEKAIGDSLSGMTTFRYETYTMDASFSYNTVFDAVVFDMCYSSVPADKLPVFFELLTLLNSKLFVNHLYIDFETNMLFLRAGILVPGYFLDRTAFKKVLRKHFAVGCGLLPLINKKIFTDQTPQSIIDEFLKSKDEIPQECLGPDGKLWVGKATKEFPFIIEASADTLAVSTHTHGLTELGMPEFLMNHRALGGGGNANRINWSYAYFIKPENADKLNAIKNGETIKLDIRDIKPGANPETLVYCYRRVYPDFEMVKQAYVIESPEDVDPKIWFVQIYIEGDDFALTDEYYKDGITC